MAYENKTMALALSGGGYRATLFALGSLWRLNELGLLKKLDRITSVSGGSIVLGYLALHWNKLTFDQNDVATNFKELIVDPLQRFCAKELDIFAAIWGWLSPWESAGEKVVKIYNKRLFGDAMLQDIAHGEGVPEFIFYATNYATGSSVRLTYNELYDYKIGKASNHTISLAQAIASSSAFPPLFSPLIFQSKDWQWQKTKYASLYDKQPLRDRVLLADGGLYDNLGIEAIWKTTNQSDGKDSYDLVLVCDAGAPMEIGFDSEGSSIFSKIIQKLGLKRNFVSQLARMSDIMISQQRALRKRELIANYIKRVYGGTYWGIATEISNYSADQKLADDTMITETLEKIPTRMTDFSAQRQAHLINWGYALSDAALRSYVDKNLASSNKLPLDAYPLDQEKL